MRVDTNALVIGFSGKLGNVIMKQINGKTFAVRKPSIPPVWSDRQKQNREKLKHAAVWAKDVLKGPEQKAFYEAEAKRLNLTNAYTAAVTDYFRKKDVAQ